MRPIQQKIAVVLSLIAVLHLAEACHNCDCADTLPFFDYASIVVETPETDVTNQFNMNILADDISYLAVATPHFHWNSVANACSCNFNGENGPKYSIEQLNIYADRDFNDTLPAGTSLNSLFLALNGDALSPLEGDAAYQSFWAIGEEEIRAIQLLMYEKPVKRDIPFRFRVELRKSDGSVLSAETGEVVFR